MLSARDRRQGDDTDLDGLDAPGQERRVTETSAAIRDHTPVTIEPESSAEEHLATTDRPIVSGRIKDQDTGIASPTEGGEPPSASQEPHHE